MAPSCISIFLSVRPSVRLEQLCSQWEDLLEILNWRFLRKSVYQIQASPKLKKKTLKSEESFPLHVHSKKWICVATVFAEVELGSEIFSQCLTKNAMDTFSPVKS
jgi:hypothetical protein